jgi:hypothetical protein
MPGPAVRKGSIKVRRKTKGADVDKLNLYIDDVSPEKRDEFLERLQALLVEAGVSASGVLVKDFDPATGLGVGTPVKIVNNTAVQGDGVKARYRKVGR